MQCVILPGGVGTRLWPLSEKSYRPVLPLANVPFVHYQLSWLAGQGITRVVYCLPPGSRVRSFAGDGRPWGPHVDYVSTAGDDGSTLSRIRQAGLLGDWFFVLSVRSFVPVSFRRMSEAFLAQSRPALLAVSCNRGLVRFGDVSFADGVVQLYQKPRLGQPQPSGMDYSDAGLSVLRHEAIEPGAWVDLPDLFHGLSLEGRLAGVEVDHDLPGAGSREQSR